MTKWDNTFNQYQDTPDAKSVQLLVKHFAQNLSDRVERIFPNELGLQYVTASALKRQVWNAVLAVTDEIQDIPKFRQTLLSKSNRQLLQEAYGTVPNGFRLALRKTGPFAQDADYYVRLHQHLINNPNDHRFLNGYTQIDERLIDIVVKLPAPMNSFKYAKYFGSPRNVHRFFTALEVLHHHDTNNPNIWMDAAKQLSQNGKPFTVVSKKFHSLSLPEPHIKHSNLRHISTVGDLISTGKRYQNCLYDLTGVALNNECQFYEWIDNTDPCIISIKADQPFGFIQGAIKAKNNADAEFVTEVTIKRLLTDLGVPDRPRASRIVRYAGQIRPYEPQHQPSDDTDDGYIGLEELMPPDDFDEAPF